MFSRTGPPNTVGGRGLARLQEGDWYQNRISPKLGQEFLLPELVPSPLAGAFVLETPIEFHCDSKHISTFYGGYFIGLKCMVEDNPF